MLREKLKSKICLCDVEQEVEILLFILYTVLFTMCLRRVDTFRNGSKCASITLVLMMSTTIITMLTRGVHYDAFKYYFIALKENSTQFSFV